MLVLLLCHPKVVPPFLKRTPTIPGYARVRTPVCVRAQAVFHAVLAQYRAAANQ